jgi:hypothetical protein
VRTIRVVRKTKVWAHTGDQGTTCSWMILFTVMISLSTVMRAEAGAIVKELNEEEVMKL